MTACLLAMTALQTAPLRVWLGTWCEDLLLALLRWQVMAPLRSRVAFKLECLSNVAEIAPDGNEPAPEVSEEGQGGDGDEELGDGAKKKGKGKGKGKKQAWDKERIVAAKIRSDLSALEDLERSINTKKQDAEKVTKELEVKSAECQTEVAVEHNLLIRRLAFVDLVLGEDKYALSHKIRSLKEAQSAQEETATVPPSKPVADMPPTSSYESLLTIGTLRKNIQSYWGCNSSAELFLGFHFIVHWLSTSIYIFYLIMFLDIVVQSGAWGFASLGLLQHVRREQAKARTAERKPLVELASATRVATAELKKAITAFGTRLSKRVPSAGAAKSKKDKDKDSLPLIIEMGMEKGSQISHMTKSKLSEILSDPENEKKFIAMGSWSMPFLIKAEDDQQQVFHSETMKSALQTFKHAFAHKVQQDRAGQGPADFQVFISPNFRSIP